MDHDPARADFLRFRSTGDVDAFARVFDALGPRLLLLAVHVCREPHLAEDLVQDTFLAAMQSADRFTADRSLGAWFAGILHHRAVDLRRARQRRPAVADAEVGELAAPPVPDAVLDAERRSHLRTAIDELDAPYREVAILRLVHGLEPIEIARALDRPAGTVRVQWSRCVARLRERLPANLFGAALLATPRPTWEAVRARVLVDAGRTVPITPTAITAGVLAMTKPKLLALCAAVVAALTWVGWPAGGTRPADAGSANPSPMHGMAAQVPEAGADPTPVRALRIDAGPEGTRAHWRITGTVTSSAGPVADAPLVAHLARGAIAAPIATTSDADGRFVLDLDAWRTLSPVQRMLGLVTIAARSPRGAGAEPVDVTLPTADDDWVTDVALTIADGATFRGRIVDALGTPIPDAFVVVRRLLDEPRGFLQTAAEASSTSDADGTFVITFDEAAVGAHELSAAHVAHGVAFVPAVRIPAVVPERPVDVGDVVLDAAQELRGTLRTADGHVAPGVRFDVRRSDERALAVIETLPIPTIVDDQVAPWTHVRASTDADGTFRLRGLADGSYWLRVRDAFGTAQEFELATSTNPHELTLTGQVWSIAVVDGNGAAVPGAPLDVRGWTPTRAPDDAAIATSHATGSSLQPPPDFALPEFVDARGRHTLLLPDGAFATLGSSVADGTFALAAERAITGLARRDVVLRLAHGATHGRVQFRVLDDSGRAVDRVGLRVWPTLVELDVVAIEPAMSLPPSPLALAPGRYRYYVFGGPEYAGITALRGSSGTFDVTAGGQTSLDVRLTAGGWLRIRAQDADGRPCRELQLVRFVDEAGTAIDGVTVDAAGAVLGRYGLVRAGESFVPLGAFPPGPLHFRLQSARASSDPTTVRIEPLAVTDVTVTMRPR